MDCRENEHAINNRWNGHFTMRTKASTQQEAFALTSVNDDTHDDDSGEQGDPEDSPADGEPS
jgi:hypothetical protein